MITTALLPIFMLYPEIHYKFRFWPFSRYFKKEPEILIDLPYKTVAGNQLPVFLLIKDAGKYPVEILSIKFNFRLPDRSVWQQEHNLNLKIQDSFFSRVFYFDFPNQTGFCRLNTEITYKIRHKTASCVNDNFSLKEKRLYSYLNDNETLFEDTLQGDLHLHSAYTADQVEYGALPKDLKTAALAMHQQFAALTDHSYDLDDCENDYLKNDPQLAKFHKMQLDCTELSDSGFTMINGEEATVRNSLNQNVHLLVLNEEKFIEGKGDSAEKWLDRHSRYNISETAAEVSSHSLLMAAHPLTPTPLLEYLLIKRGEWQSADLLNSAVPVWQIMNGEEDTGFIRGKQLWISTLLSGIKKFIAAGNDSHGNFAVFRQIKLPMFKMIRAEKQLFGYWRTVVLAKPDKESILSAVRSGCSYITSGPHIMMNLCQKNGEPAFWGQQLPVSDTECRLDLKILSSRYSGKIKKITLFYGRTGAQAEQVTEISFPSGNSNLSISEKISCRHSGYIRIEVIAETTDRFGRTIQHKAFTNPIFIK